MTNKTPKEFGRSIDWTVTTDEKELESLDRNSRIIAEELDSDDSVLPDKNKLDQKIKNKHVK